MVYCKVGGRSARAVEALTSQFGISKVASLRGGIDAWIEEIDPSLTKY